MSYHPDRVPSEEKTVSNEKFNIIHQAYKILCDAQSKKAYDEGSNVLFAKATNAAQWEQFLKPTVEDELDNARKNYQNSLDEIQDIKREFVAGKGSLTHIYNNVPFVRYEDEPRIIEIIRGLIDNGDLPSLKIKKIVTK